MTLQFLVKSQSKAVWDVVTARFYSESTEARKRLAICEKEAVGAR